MNPPNDGERVLVRPRLGLSVQAHQGVFGRHLVEEWQEMTWSEWLLRRWRSGELEWTPIPVAAPSAPEKELA